MASDERTMRYHLHPEDGGFVARCLDVNVASDGNTEQEAAENLREALELYFEGAEDFDGMRMVQQARVDSRQ